MTTHAPPTVVLPDEVSVVNIGLPLFARSGSALTMLSLMGIMIIFALSYNMLLGQTGMLLFGHAVYYGLGAFFVVHAMNAIIRAKYPVPLPALPLHRPHFPHAFEFAHDAAKQAVGAEHQQGGDEEQH